MNATVDSSDVDEPEDDGGSDTEGVAGVAALPPSATATAAAAPTFCPTPALMRAGASVVATCSSDWTLHGSAQRDPSRVPASVVAHGLRAFHRAPANCGGRKEPGASCSRAAAYRCERGDSRGRRWCGVFVRKKRDRTVSSVGRACSMAAFRGIWCMDHGARRRQCAGAVVLCSLTRRRRDDTTYSGSGLWRSGEKVAASFLAQTDAIEATKGRAFAMNNSVALRVTVRCVECDVCTTLLDHRQTWRRR